MYAFAVIAHTDAFNAAFVDIDVDARAARI
jgi:hypothetical protein